MAHRETRAAFGDTAFLRSVSWVGAPRLFLFELQPVFSCNEATMKMGAFPYSGPCSCLAHKPSFLPFWSPSPSLFLHPLVAALCRKPAQQFL